MMEEFSWQSFIWIAMALVLPISALVGQRLNWKKGVILALIWASIFAVTAAFITIVRG